MPDIQDIVWDVTWFVAVFLLLEWLCFGGGDTNDVGPK